MHLVTSTVANPMLAGDRLQRFIAGHQPPTRPVPARNGTYAPSPGRLATKVVGVWKETASGAKKERAELTRWGRSMLDLFHTLQIYKPGVWHQEPRLAHPDLLDLRYRLSAFLDCDSEYIFSERFVNSYP
jgi:hypothetical protein